jgi:hypothetical protein
MDLKDISGLYEAYLDVYNESEDVEEGYEHLGVQRPDTYDSSDRDKSRGIEAKWNFPHGRDRRGKRITNQIDKIAQTDPKRSEKIVKTLLKSNSGVSKAKSAENKRIGPAKRDAERDMRQSGWMDSYDYYDLVLDYLIDEGLCDSQENAEAMMAHMSEEWVESIIEGFVPLSQEKRERVENAIEKNLSDRDRDMAAGRKYKKRLESLPKPLRRFSRSYKNAKKFLDKYHHNPKGLNKKELLGNASDALMHTSIDKTAKTITKRNELNRRLKNME